MSALLRLGLSQKKTAVFSGGKISKSQKQTQKAFGYKWSRRESYESLSVARASRKWLLERYCTGDAGRLSQWLRNGRKIILDAGCGSGFSALLFFASHLKRHDYLGVDISNAVEVAKRRFQEKGLPGDFLQCDLLRLPVPEQSVDLIFSEGVLHHTDNTGDAIFALSKKLKKGGRFLFYVYAKKAPAREFTDDLIREHFQKQSDEETWEALKPLTRLGMELGKLKAIIKIPEAIPFLEIPKGKMDLQRFFYWYFVKAYFRPEFRFEENHHINFDWFRPTNCHRHTKEQVLAFCKKAGLSVEHWNEQLSGFTVVARKL